MGLPGSSARLSERAQRRRLWVSSAAGRALPGKPYHGPSEPCGRMSRCGCAAEQGHCVAALLAGASAVWHSQASMPRLPSTGKIYPAYRGSCGLAALCIQRSAKGCNKLGQMLAERAAKSAEG